MYVTECNGRKCDKVEIIEIALEGQQGAFHEAKFRDQNGRVEIGSSTRI